MRLEALLITALMLTTGLAGCIDAGSAPEDGSDDEVLEQQSQANATSDSKPSEGADQDGTGPEPGTSDQEEEQGNQTQDAGEPADEAASKAQEHQDDAAEPQPTEAPQAVVAHIDTGVNPYHEAFRDRSPLAYTHPSEYIEGYPEDVPALNLTLDAGTWEIAIKKDAHIWENVEEGQLYWIPGTRIVGAISFGPGGTNAEVDEEHRILDDHGHGTMTGSRSVGDGSSLAPGARLVTIEGLGARSVQWAADQGWIDVQTNSWITFVPAGVNRPPVANTSQAFANAADRMVTLAASGNGAAYLAGVAPTPTYTLSTAPDGVLLVGGHDNGKVAPWSGSPPHVVADGFRGLAAERDSTTEITAHGFSCCTSAASPYAAGAVADLILTARQALGDSSEGIRDGIVAQGQNDDIQDGPLADGQLTKAELEELFLATAQARPTATPHDGDTHWTGQPGDTPEDPTNPGENEYCPGCWTVPVAWSQVPGDVPAYVYLGYGGINLHSQTNATQVLLGNVDLPAREQADTFFGLDQTAREALYP